MKRFGAICALMTMLGTVCRARIGESLEQCIERYGPVVETRPAQLPQSDPVAAVFSKNGVTIMVEFSGSEAWRITFRKPKFSAIEMEALLAANSGANTWSPPLRFGDREYRLGSDRSRLAATTLAANSDISQIEILLREYAERLHANILARGFQPAAPGQAKPKANPLPGF
jgi:hypothetical protein